MGWFSSSKACNCPDYTDVFNSVARELEKASLELDKEYPVMAKKHLITALRIIAVREPTYEESVPSTIGGNSYTRLRGRAIWN